MKKVFQILTMVFLVALTVGLAPATVTHAQGEVVCDQDVTVQADDWLSKIAEKVYGDVLAYTFYGVSSSSCRCCLALELLPFY